MRDEKEYVIFCDESDSKGRFCSDFYGGVLVPGSKLESITDRLSAVMEQQNLRGEVKWQKVTDQYLGKYRALMTAFFDELRAGHAKIRIMFTQNSERPVGLTQEDRDLGYFKLYYQFLKHAFGLAYVENVHPLVNLRIYLDDMPDTKERCSQFKAHLHHLPQRLESRATRGVIEEKDVAEVRSHDHVLLQCLDIVLGSMCFRLNNKHKEKPPGQRLRGKRTVAKEELYRHIHKEICSLRERFNIGISTAFDGDPANAWNHPYRHWRFQSSEVEHRSELTKRHKKENPTQPT